MKNIIKTAELHGYQNIPMSTDNIVKFTELTPVEQILPKSKHGIIVIYYRFDCPDCHKIHEQLTKALNLEYHPEIYYVCSRSVQGQKLMKTYSIDTVPTAIYIPLKSDNIVSYPLAITKNNKTIFAKDNFERLLQLQKEKR